MHTKIKAILDISTIPYSVHWHKNFSVEIKSPTDFAMAIGYPLERVTKSVFLRTKEGGAFIMAVCSSNKKMDLEAIRNIIGGKKVTMASAIELDSLIGYPVTGVSPIGIPENIFLVIDEFLLKLETILIGAGTVGVEIEISPDDLIKITKGKVFPISMLK